MGPIDPPTVYMVLLAIIVALLGVVAWLLDRAQGHQRQLIDRENIITALRSTVATLQDLVDAWGRP